MPHIDSFYWQTSKTQEVETMKRKFAFLLAFCLLAAFFLGCAQQTQDTGRTPQASGAAVLKMPQLNEAK